MGSFKNNVIRATVSITLLSISITANASGLLLPDEMLRNDLAFLSERGIINLGLSTWPLSQDEVARALKNAQTQNASERAVLQRVDHRMAVLKSNARITAHSFSNETGTPQGFADSVYAGQDVSLALNLGGEEWDVHLQGNAEADMQISNGSRFNLNDSYAALRFANQWLAFGQIPQWWGPGNEGSLIRSDAARPVTGFLMQRAEQTAPETWWLNWIGPWQYQLTAGELNQYTSVPHTLLTGGRVTFSPLSSLELGASRMMQWGGDGRSKSFSTFMDGMTGQDNTGTGNEPGNQLAGFDFKLKLQPTFGWPINFYGQMIGEDEAGFMPSGNLFLGGVEGHHSVGKDAINWYVEAHDTRRNFGRLGSSYTHHIYTDGYYQQGYPLGDAIGGDGRLLAGKVELATEDSQRWSARLVYARVNPESQEINQAFPRSDTLTGLQLGWSGDVYRSARLKVGVWYTEANHSDNDAGLGVGAEIPFNW